jgi:hypothetical protein
MNTQSDIVSSSMLRCWVMVIAVLFPCVVIFYAVYLSTKPPSDQPSTQGTRAVPSLEFVVVVSRHGNRRPLYSFPNEPYPDKFWSCELGEVTKHGKLEMYNLGVKIRSLYDGFLNTTYSRHLRNKYTNIKDFGERGSIFGRPVPSEGESSLERGHSLAAYSNLHGLPR